MIILVKFETNLKMYVRRSNKIFNLSIYFVENIWTYGKMIVMLERMTRYIFKDIYFLSFFS